jgi:hypothetical protein
MLVSLAIFTTVSLFRRFFKALPEGLPFGEFVSLGV